MVPIDLSPLTEMVEIAVQVRPTEPFALDPLEARQEEIEASEQLLALVPDYTAENLSGSIACFIEALCGSPPETLEELKTDKVYASRSQKVVVKVYAPKGEGRGLYQFVREISGQKALEDLELTSGSVVKILSAGKCTLYGQDHFLLALSLAPGKEVKQFINPIFTDSDKESAIAQCQKVLHRLGEVLAEMHLRKAVTFNTSPELAAYARREIALSIHKSLREYKKNGGILVEKIRRVFEEKLAQTQPDRLTVAQGHGDSHLNNFLYDPATDQITIIDTSRAHVWVDPQGAPLHPIHVRDVARTIDDIAKWVLHIAYDPVIIEGLTSSFKAGYFEKAPDLISPAELDLKVSYLFLERLKSAILWENELSKASQQVKKRIYDYYLSSLLNSQP